MNPAYAGARLRLDVTALAAGARHVIASPPRDESVAVLLAGEVEWNGVTARRGDVFDGPASACYVPPAATVEVHARARSELALVATTTADLARSRAEPTTVGPADVAVHRRGRPGWERAVHDVVAGGVPAQRLVVGETFNEPGQWSSFPPHKHDGGDGEPACEEVYYFRFDKPEGFGFQGLYDADGDGRAILVRHGTVVGIPRGYHPVSAAPGYRLYYLWALAGTSRRLSVHEDPAHRWLHAPRHP
jgi:5-deoxy-glucuronate isomerase